MLGGVYYTMLGAVSSVKSRICEYRRVMLKLVVLLVVLLADSLTGYQLTFNLYYYSVTFCISRAIQHFPLHNFLLDSCSSLLWDTALLHFPRVIIPYISLIIANVIFSSELIHCEWWSVCHEVCRRVLYICIIIFQKL